MDGWMDGWLDGWIAGWLDGWMDYPAGQLRIARWLVGWLDGWAVEELSIWCTVAGATMPYPLLQ